MSAAIARPIAKVFDGRRGRGYLAGVHQPVGVEQPFHLAERREELRPEELEVVIAAREAVAVLSRHGAAEFEHQGCHVIRNRFENLEVARRLRVDHRANVQAAD